MATTTSAAPSLDLQDYLQKLQDASKTKGTDSRKTGSTLDKNQFMTLMVTQLRFQDPLNPQDNQQMAAQMAQFSSLEALQNMQTSMTKMGDSISASVDKQSSSAQTMATTSAMALVGDHVRMRRPTMDHSGSAESIEVHATPGSVLALIDKEGKTVREIPLEGKNSDGTDLLAKNGDGVVKWDGTDEQGAKVDSGAYTLVVRDQASGAETGYAYVESTVTGVGRKDGATILNTDAGDFPLSDLVQAVAGGSGKSASKSGSGSDFSAVSLVGREVRVRDASASLSYQSGHAALAAWNCSAQDGGRGQILDAEGKVVREFNLRDPKDGISVKNSGSNLYQVGWDGSTDAGSAAPEGTYYLRLVSPDATSLQGTTFQTIKVDSIGIDTDGSTLLLSGGQAWGLDQLYTVS